MKAPEGKTFRGLPSSGSAFILHPSSFILSAMSALPKRHFTPEEYLQLEVKAEYKSQYVAGEIYAMAGADHWHIEIMDNLTKAFGPSVFRRPPLPQPSPATCACRPPRANSTPTPTSPRSAASRSFNDTIRPGSLLNPQVIFEILSPSTEAFDRGDKFARYRKLPSLTDYVLVASEFMRVEHFVRQENGHRLDHDRVQSPRRRRPAAPARLHACRWRKSTGASSSPATCPPPLNNGAGRRRR